MIKRLKFGKIIVCWFLVFVVLSCNSNKDISFGEDLNFLKKHLSVIELSNENAKVIIAPELQGRVLTSSSQGLEGRSYGWVNRKRVEEGPIAKNNNTGGEDRLWFGPEYGKYAIFFKAGDAMIGANVKVPNPIDSESFELISQNDSEVLFEKEMSFFNYSNYQFNIKVKRRIKLFSNFQIEEKLNINLNENIHAVGFGSENTLINTSDNTWSRDTGLLSIWNIGAFYPSEQLTVVLPLKKKATNITNYWSEAGTDRLIIKDEVAYYKADANYLHKIGVLPSLAKAVFGSYDAERGVLTIVKYSLNPDAIYVNSQWDDNVDPYKGDAINVFNDGVTDEGEGPFGPFYELETSSSTKALASQESITHNHYTFHFEGNKEALNKICKSILNVSLEDIKKAFD
jgi:hypothetical protein